MRHDGEQGQGSNHAVDVLECLHRHRHHQLLVEGKHRQSLSVGTAATLLRLGVAVVWTHVTWVTPAGDRSERGAEPGRIHGPQPNGERAWMPTGPLVREPLPAFRDDQSPTRDQTVLYTIRLRFVVLESRVSPRCTQASSTQTRRHAGKRRGSGDFARAPDRRRRAGTGGCGLTPLAMCVATLVLTNRHASLGRFGISDSFPPCIIAVPSCEGVDPRSLNVNGGPCQAGCPELGQGNVRRMATRHEDA